MNLRKVLASEYEKRHQKAEKKLLDLSTEMKSREESLNKIKKAIEDKEIALKKFQETKPADKAPTIDIMKFVREIDDIKHNLSNIDRKVNKFSKNAPSPYRQNRYGNISGLSLSERKEILSRLNFTKRIINIPSVVAEGKESVRQAILKISGAENSKGAVIKNLDAKYSTGESDSWSKFRNSPDIHVRVIEKVPKDSGMSDYVVGIDLSKEDAKKSNPAKTRTIGDKTILEIGNTLTTKDNAKEGDIIDVIVEEVWKHETKKGDHYSIHNPTFKQVTNMDSTSTTKDLEDIVTGLGAKVKDFAVMHMDVESAKKTLKNWPKWVQEGLTQLMTKKAWTPFVIQHHYRGTTSEDEGFDYNLKSVHSDFRHFIPKNLEGVKDGETIKYEAAKKMEGICYGVTVNTPPSVDKPDEWDNDVKHILCEGKLPIPKGWLYVEGTAKINEPGSSWYGGRSIAPGVLVRAAYGEAMPVEVSDHIIKLQFRPRSGDVNSSVFEQAEKKGIKIENRYDKNLKDLDGIFEFTINHIGDKWLIFLNKVKTRGKKQSITKEMMNEIFEMSSTGNHTRSEIAKSVGVSKSTIYNYQRYLGLL